MTVRKNFIFDQKVAEYLEELAKKRGTTQTKIVQEAIEKQYKKELIGKKLQALDSLAGSCNGLLTDVDLKQVRLERASYRAK